MIGKENLVVIYDELAAFEGVEGYPSSDPSNVAYLREAMTAIKELNAWTGHSFVALNHAQHFMTMEGPLIDALIMSEPPRLVPNYRTKYDPLLALSERFQIPRAILIGDSGLTGKYIRKDSCDALIPRMPIESMGGSIVQWLSSLSLSGVKSARAIDNIKH